MSGRPDWISKDEFRKPCTAHQLNKMFVVDGIQPASYIARAERNKRPIRQIAAGLWRPLDVIARARAECLAVTMPKARALKQENAELERERDRLRQEIERLRCELGTTHELGMASLALTGKTLLSEAEIVRDAIHPQTNSGVYFLISRDSVIYVGQSVDVFSRVRQHIALGFDRFAYVPCDRDNLDILESLYIHALRPPKNGTHRDGRPHAPLELLALLPKGDATDQV